MINLKEHNDKIREKVKQMFLEDSVSYVSENKNNKKSNFITYTVILILGLLGLVFFKLKMR